MSAADELRTALGLTSEVGGDALHARALTEIHLLRNDVALLQADHASACDRIARLADERDVARERADGAEKAAQNRALTIERLERELREERLAAFSLTRELNEALRKVTR